MDTDLGNDENVNFNNRFRLDVDGNRIDSTLEPENDQKEKLPRYNTLQVEKKKLAMEEKVCRICLCEEEDTNPIISPCKCIGSVRYIHLLCIQEWLESKKHKKETPFVNSYIWRGLECEICKS